MYPRRIPTSTTHSFLSRLGSLPLVVEVLGLILLSSAIGIPSTASAADPHTITLTPTGFSMPTIGADDPIIMSYPALLTANDAGLKPENISVAPDGKSVTMTYTPSGKCVIQRKEGDGIKEKGFWTFRFTEIPQDRVKFAFGMRLPLSLAAEAAGVKPSEKPLIFFPEQADKDKITLYNGNPESLTLTRLNGGFTLRYPHKTWTMVRDHRPWGQHFFRLDHILYFPGKKHVDAIDYTLGISEATPAP